jgi:hypothetical protein
MLIACWPPGLTDTTTAAQAMASPATSGAAAGDRPALPGSTTGALPSPCRTTASTTSTGTDDNAVEELEVIMGHPSLKAPGTVSLSEAMGPTHFALK